MDESSYLALDPLDQGREEQVQLDGRLEGGLQAHLHHPGRRVENLRGLDFLLACNLVQGCQLDSLLKIWTKILRHTRLIFLFVFFLLYFIFKLLPSYYHCLWIKNRSWQPCLFGTLGEVVLAVLVVLDEQHRDRPERHAAKYRAIYFPNWPLGEKSGKVSIVMNQA